MSSNPEMSKILPTMSLEELKFVEKQCLNHCELDNLKLVREELRDRRSRPVYGARK